MGKGLVFIILFSALLLSSCKKSQNSEKILVTTGMSGKIEYGVGDCMPIIGGPNRIYSLYNGTLYFVIKSQYENPDVYGNINILKWKSINTKVINGYYSIELPIDTFVVMPSEIYEYSKYNTVITEKDINLEKDFKFWQCTSY